jgi:hypothetical protein
MEGFILLLLIYFFKLEDVWNMCPEEGNHVIIADLVNVVETEKMKPAG